MSMCVFVCLFVQVLHDSDVNITAQHVKTKHSLCIFCIFLLSLHSYVGCVRAFTIFFLLTMFFDLNEMHNLELNAQFDWSQL